RTGGLASLAVEERQCRDPGRARVPARGRGLRRRRIWCMRPALDRAASSREEEAPPWFRDGPADITGRLDPLACNDLQIRERLFRRRSVGGTPGQLRHLPNEGLVFLAPIDNHFVFELLAHRYGSANLYFKTISRTCLTW